jgi:hypothetical protein
VQASVSQACGNVKGCQKAELRLVYLRDQQDWQKQLLVSGKNVAADDVGAALEKIVERDVRYPVYRWMLHNAHPINK